MRRIRVWAAALVLVGAAAVRAQQSPDAKTQLAPGFLLRPNGLIDIGDIYVEVNFYDTKWTISQQHDKFEAKPMTPPAAAGGAYVLTGVLSTAVGPATYTQRVTPAADGVKLAAELTSEKPLVTNELSMTYILPFKTFGGKQMRVDSRPVELPQTPAKKGEARLFNQTGVHRLELPTPGGTLVVTGTFDVLLNDDREWNDPRYSLRLGFTPVSGAITSSKIDLDMRLAPTP